MEHSLGSTAIFKYSRLIGFTLQTSIEKLKSENMIFQCYQSLNSHSAGGCSNENRLINFNILGSNCLQRTTATRISSKVSVEILDCNFFQIAFTDKQANVMPLNNDHCATSHWSKQFMSYKQSLNILAHFIRNFKN